MKKLLTALMAFGTPAAAEITLTDCGDWRANAAYIAEPWFENTVTFGDGITRVAVLDTVEPAASSRNLLILSPPYSETGERQCRLLTGFSGLSLEGMDAGYDPSIGIYLTLTAQVYLEYEDEFASAQVDLRINQATGDIEHYVTPYFQ